MQLAINKQIINESQNWTRQLQDKLLAMSFPMLEYAYTRNRSASSDLARQMCSTTMNFRCACIAQLLARKKKNDGHILNQCDHHSFIKRFSTFLAHSVIAMQLLSAWVNASA